MLVQNIKTTIATYESATRYSRGTQHLFLPGRIVMLVISRWPQPECAGGADCAELNCFSPAMAVTFSAVVSDFACVARNHLRRYKLDANGSLLPTKDGITVTPSVWLSLVREFSAIDQAFHDGKVSMLKETEWNALKDIQKQITSKTVSIMFGHVSLKLLRKKVAKHIPFPKSDFDCIDAEIVLPTSMVELLCSHI
ncbi:PC4 domain-containing protein [Trichonephila clavipes]|nr:PC4 domain-containing protein [Trichonephila clavipes]